MWPVRPPTLRQASQGRVEVLGVGACGGPVGGALPRRPSASQPPLLPRVELLEKRVQEGRAAQAPAQGPLSAAGLLSRARSLIWMGAGSPGRERALHASDSCKCSHGVCGVTRFPDTGLKVHGEKRTSVVSSRLGVC